MKHCVLIILFMWVCLIANAIKPDSVYRITPENLQLKYEEKYLKTNDNFNVKSWHLFPQTEDTKGITIVISYGDAGNMSYWLDIGISLAWAGYDVWMYDYRGFGNSTKFEMNPDQLYYEEFLNDLSSVVKKAKESNSENKLCLFGLSMGTIINTLYMNNKSENIDFYIGEGLIYSPTIVIDRLKYSRPNKQLTIPDKAINVEEIYPTISVPVLLFCASDDVLCTQVDMDNLRLNIETIEIKTFEGKHLQGIYALKDEYIQTINCFFQKTYNN